MLQLRFLDVEDMDLKHLLLDTGNRQTDTARAEARNNALSVEGQGGVWAVGRAGIPGGISSENGLQRGKQEEALPHRVGGRNTLQTKAGNKARAGENDRGVA
jgi:hypothetical protein